jgi:chromosome segregation ATPase
MTFSGLKKAVQKLGKTVSQKVATKTGKKQEQHSYDSWTADQQAQLRVEIANVERELTVYDTKIDTVEKELAELGYQCKDKKLPSGLPELEDNELVRAVSDKEGNDCEDLYNITNWQALQLEHELRLALEGLEDRKYRLERREKKLASLKSKRASA